MGFSVVSIHSRFPLLGNGLYSSVYSTKSNRKVIKITTLDDAWLKYILWAHGRGFCGSFAPRLYGLRNVGNDYVLAIVERLERANSHFQELAGADDYYETVGRLREYVGYRYFPPDHIFAGWNIFTKAAIEDRIGYTFNDAHDGNWLFRKGFGLVLNDPCDGGDVIHIPERAFDLRSLRPKARHFVTDTDENARARQGGLGNVATLPG